MIILHKLSLLLLLVLSLGCVACEWQPGPSVSARYVFADPHRGIRCLCVNGYMYMLYERARAGGLTQMWEDGPNGPRPMHCPATEESAY